MKNQLNEDAVELSEVILFGCSDLASCELLYGAEAIYQAQTLYPDQMMSYDTTTTGGCTVGSDGWSCTGSITKTK